MRVHNLIKWNYSFITYSLDTYCLWWQKHKTQHYLTALCLTKHLEQPILNALQTAATSSSPASLKLTWIHTLQWQFPRLWSLKSSAAQQQVLRAGILRWAVEVQGRTRECLLCKLPTACTQSWAVEDGAMPIPNEYEVLRLRTIKMNQQLLQEKLHHENSV